MQDSFQLADVLGRYLKWAGYTPGRLARLSGLPKATIVNWLEGRAKKPRLWQDLVRVAAALGVSKSDATTLLRSAGHHSIDELLEHVGDEKDRALLSHWAEEIHQPQQAPAPAPPSAVFDPAMLAAAQRQLAALPLDTIPDPAPLPPGSRMPLHRNPLFVDREADLRGLARALKGSEAGTTGQGPVAAVTGLGGTGKTQLATEFVHRYGQYFAGVFWLSFADPEAVPAEVAACGDHGFMALYPGFGNLPLDDQVQLVRAAWQDPLPRLLVFDNCEDEALLARWRPPSGCAFVLLTSRRGEWDPTLGVQALAIDVLPREEAVALLRKYQPDVAAADPTLDAIAAELGDLPLALHLAGTYLRRYRHAVTPAAYLAQLRQPMLLDHPSLTGAAISPTGHVQHVARTFALSYGQLDPADPVDRLALALLARAACFAPGEPIPRDLLLATARLSVVEPDAVMEAEDALARLVALGLVGMGTDGTLRLHRLVITFVQGRLTDSGAQAAVEQTLRETADRLNDVGDLQSMLALQTHLRFVADTALVRNDERAAALCSALGSHLLMISDYAGAQIYLERSLAIREQTPDSNPINVAASFNMLGLFFQLQGDFTKARTLFEQALAIWEKTLGPEELATATGRNNLGYLLVFLGDYAAAQAYLQQALATRRQKLGLKHRETARSLNNLGYLFLKLGQYARARRYLKLALTIRQEVLPPNHISTAQTLSFLGEVLYAQGNYAEARTYLEQALAMRRELYGDDHYDTAESLYHLGRVLQAQGDAAEAGAYLERSLAIRRTVLGETHPDTIQSLEAISEMR